MNGVFVPPVPSVRRMQHWSPVAGGSRSWSRDPGVVGSLCGMRVGYGAWPHSAGCRNSVAALISGAQSLLRLLGRNCGAEMPVALSNYMVIERRSTLLIARLCFSSLPVEGGIAFSYLTAYFRLSRAYSAMLGVKEEWANTSRGMGAGKETSACCPILAAKNGDEGKALSHPSKSAGSHQ